MFVTPDSAPQEEETDNLVDRIRDKVVPTATAGGDARAYVSGQAAAFKDIADRIFDRMPLFLVYIIGVMFLVLAMAFRSILISAKSLQIRRSRRPDPNRSEPGRARRRRRPRASCATPSVSGSRESRCSLRGISSRITSSAPLRLCL